MKEQPMLFSAPMVRAILDGRKTQTRRVVKPQPEGFWGSIQGHALAGGILQCVATSKGHTGDHYIRCPYGVPGDRLWVRETFWNMTLKPRCYTGLAAGAGVLDSKMSAMTHSMTAYRASGWGDKRPEGCSKWKPAIHMPRTLSRITLEITEVRVQRLQDISEQDAKAEGADPIAEEVSSDPAIRYRAAFHSLWTSINGLDSWDANPWVWALTFKRVTQTV